MTEQEIRDFILHELPAILQNDRSLREHVLRMAEGRFADKEETHDRFDQVLDELRRDREESTRRWEESAGRWQENQRRWEESAGRWQENERRWEESAGRSQENQRRWEENQKAINAILEELREGRRRYDAGIGALGARWGIKAESSFREALKGILEDTFHVEVLNVNEFDDAGEVFGRPDQIELDIVVKNGTLIVCEIKSSVSKGDVFIFDRKVRFYEKRHGRTATRRLVISPMIDAKARVLAKKLGVETFTSPDAMEDEGAGL